MPPSHWQMHATILGDMIAACLEGCTSNTEAPGNRTLAQVESVIAEHIGDFDLGPSRIAAELGLPLRTLQAATASAGVTLGRMIMQRRLHHAAQQGPSHCTASPRAIYSSAAGPRLLKTAAIG